LKEFFVLPGEHSARVEEEEVIFDATDNGLFTLSEEEREFVWGTHSYCDELSGKRLAR
jgi:hypothetical protein